MTVPPSGRSSVRKRPDNGRNAVEASAASPSVAPAAVAAAIAASALATLWRPGARKSSFTLPSGVVTSTTEPHVSMRKRAVTAAAARMPKSRSASVAPSALRRTTTSCQNERVVVVGIDHRDAALRQRADQRRVLGGDVGDAFHEFLVLALRVVDHADGRLRDRREFRGFARVVHSDLDHRGAMRARASRAR